LEDVESPSNLLRFDPDDTRYPDFKNDHREFTYQLRLTHKNTDETFTTWRSDNIHVYDDQDTLRELLLPFYRDIVGTDIEVEQEFEIGDNTGDTYVAGKEKNCVYPKKHLPGSSFLHYAIYLSKEVIGEDYSHTLVISEEDSVASTGPISGSYKIKCTEANVAETIHYSSPFKYNEPLESIKHNYLGKMTYFNNKDVHMYEIKDSERSKNFWNAEYENGR